MKKGVANGTFMLILDGVKKARNRIIFNDESFSIKREKTSSFFSFFLLLWS